MSTYPVCPECGAPLAELIEGSSLALSCDNCGWSIATTWTEPINEDETLYHLRLHVNLAPTKEALSVISKIAGCNFIAAKQLLANPNVDLISCFAPEMKQRAEQLDAAGVDFTITPPFPY